MRRFFACHPRSHRSLRIYCAVVSLLVTTNTGLRPLGGQAPARVNADPGPRKGHALVYDAGARRVLLVDASPPNDPAPRRQEVWSWDGARWRLLSAASGATTPPAHTTGAVVFDLRRRTMMIYGGRTGAMTQNDVASDTWEWDGSHWRQGTDSSIGARDHIAMAYDRSRDRTVLFGGAVFPRIAGPWASDTWEWDGAVWRRVAIDGPVGRITTMAYDARRGEVVLFGGHGDGQPAIYFGDTWLWNGRSWRPGPAGPIERSGHAMAFDARTGVVLLYGGGTRAGCAPFRELDDFWMWDGVSWRRVMTSGPSPGARVGHAMAYDSARNRLVLYGGSRGRTILDDTWEWDGERW